MTSFGPGRGLLSGARELPPWLVPRYIARRAAEHGGSDALLYLQDYDQQVLLPFADDGSVPEPEPEPAEQGLVGTAFATLDIAQAPAGEQVRVALPLVDGGERVGVLVLTVPPLDDASREHWLEFAAVTAALIVSKGRHTDVYFQARRRQPLTLGAEMQWSLLPPLAVLDPRLALAGHVEPAYELGGDAFDYAINHETAHLAVFDAMGHDLDAAVMCSVAVAAYRHERRANTPIEKMYEAVDEQFARQFQVDRFVTAQLASLHLPSGLLRMVNAGHPAPLHIRAERVLGELAGEVTLPLGLRGPAPEVTTVQLQPGDRLLLFTDGVVEARRDGEPYGTGRLVSDLERVLHSQAPAADVLRRLAGRIAQWRGGPSADDATLVLAEWRSAELSLP